MSKFAIATLSPSTRVNVSSEYKNTVSVFETQGVLVLEGRRVSYIRQNNVKTESACMTFPEMVGNLPGRKAARLFVARFSEYLASSALEGQIPHITEFQNFNWLT